MGVPKFYRWLSERYPLINQLISNTTMLPEIDNFYLDMNGIIHACTHPNDSDTSIKLSLRDMILAIFRYIDRCVSGIVKPKKLLYLAIDGVAPRAKLNQQRSRRFRAGQERIENLMKSKQKGEIIDESTMFDSNCITPGTEFMSIIDKHLRYFIRKKIKEDPIWKNLEVIYSGHDVPGEGEHKIMQYIREARSKPNYQPNQRHCLYGQDADLIMLGLATHEPHFTLLREVVDFNSGRSQGSGKRDTVMKQTRDSRFQLLHLSVLREYIEVDFANNHQGEPIDRERLIDDFIFLTFLVGNDFLPHLPTLDISEHAFDFLFDIYRNLLQENVGYIVGNGEIVDYERLGKLFSMIGVREEEILRTRELEQKEFNAKRRKNRRGYQVEEIISIEEEEQEEIELQAALEQAIAESIEESKLTNQLDNSLQITNSSNIKNIETNNSNNNGNNNNNNNNEISKSDKNYRARYYFEKFRIVPDNYSNNFNQFINEITIEYLKGIIWCLAYYMKGCISWTWYFPYHYGPMLGDMTNILEKSRQITFDLGKPFLPFQQLLGCLPPSSMNLLPLSYQWLMNSSSSPIIEYYPLHFEIDMNGKRNPWEAVVLLPFIDSKRLLEAEKLYCPETSLTLHERQRNSFGKILHVIFDPINMETIPSCNPAIGLLDISKCQSKIHEKDFNLNPEVSFAAKLIRGTVPTCAGFPSLGVIPIASATLEAVKLNIFGSESRYKSIILTVFQREFTPENFQFELLLGRSVFVNYPLIHEAKVVGVTCATKSCKLRTRRVGKQDIQEIEQTIHSDSEKLQWLKDSATEESKYLKGRGEPGTGGIIVGNILIRLLVVPLQGMKTDRLTGIRKKVFGETIADIPIQMALWTSPVADARFEERDEIMSVDSMFPYGSLVVATEGPLKGMSGTVIGPHGPLTNSSNSRVRLSDLQNNNNNNHNNQSTSISSSRVVDVEFTMYPPEPPFGYALNVSVKDEYFSSREICRQLGITPSVLGLICGSLFVDPVRMDIGLNLKKNGEYQLLEYARGIVVSNSSSSNNSLPEPGVPGKELKTCWNSGDTIRIIGSLSPSQENNSNNVDDENNQKSSSGQTIWEYSEKAVDLIRDYMTAFPILFSRLQSLANQRKYTVHDLFGLSGVEAENELNRLQTWMKSQPFYLLPRSPLTTTSMSKDAIHAVERAVDVRVSRFTSEEGQQEIKKVVKRNVPVEVLFRDQLYGPFDTPLTSINPNPPELGDRVINLVATGVPFGLKGTVITIHSGTGYVEVLFDEEFAAGKSLQGNCSPFRGALVAWTTVLCISTNPFSNNNNNNNNQSIRNKTSNGASNKNTPNSRNSKNEKVSTPEVLTQVPAQENTTTEIGITTNTTTNTTPPQMKKVTSILRKEMLSRQNNSPSTPVSTTENSTSLSTPIPQPPLQPPLIPSPVAFPAPAPIPDPIPVPISTLLSSPQSNQNETITLGSDIKASPQSTEKSSSSSVAEMLLKARSAMKEKLNQYKKEVVEEEKTSTNSNQTTDEISEKGSSSTSFQPGSIRLKISGADLFPSTPKTEPQEQKQEENQEKQEENQEEELTTDSLLPSNSPVNNDSIKSSQPTVKHLVPSRVARKIVTKEQKK